MTALFPVGWVEGIEILAGRSRRLRRRMVALQTCALRRARAGRHRAASDRWKAMLRAHLVRQSILRAAGVL